MQRSVFQFLLAGLLAVQTVQGADFDFFENNIRPLLIEKCYKCHSVQSGKFKGGLLLDTKDATLKGGDNGPAVVPGDLGKSLLIKAVRYSDADLKMPPSDQKLTDAQIADLTAWVKMSAPDPRTSPATNTPQAPYDLAAARKQWAFHAPADPPVPKVKNVTWAKTPIDHFILAKLEEKHLAPAPAADKRTLIRRATFDLTGLPPTPSEVETFLKDHSTNAFAKVVDRLLASPHYGERWGRHWLDVVRYTDSLDARASGDGDITEAYRYRDWVVGAFNRDLPYNEFIREQIAGDLLQPKDPAQIDTNAIIATGMYAIGNWGNGDADKDKILTDIADDQVDVTGRAFLGVTMACARCHDHKFDPLLTADYYSMAGIFFSSHILPHLTPKGQGEDLLFIPLASKAELDHRQKREDRMADLQKSISAANGTGITNAARAMLPRVAEFLAAAGKKNPPADPWQTLWNAYLGFGETKLLTHVEHDAQGKMGLHTLHNANYNDTPAGMVNITDQPISFGTITLPAHTVAIHPSPSAGVAVGWTSPLAGTFSLKGRVADADPNCGDGIEWKLMIQRVTGLEELASGAIPNGGMQDFAEGKGSVDLKSVSVREGEMISLVVLPKAEYSCDSTVVELELTEARNPKQVWNLSREIIASVVDGSNPYPDAQGHPAVWRIYDMAGQAAIGAITPGSPFAHYFSAISGQGSVTEAAREIQMQLLSTNVINSSVAKIYADLMNPNGPFWSGADVSKIVPGSASDSLAVQRAELAALQKENPPALARANGMLEGGVPGSPHAGLHDVKIHLRGRYDHLGDLAPRRFPRLLAGDNQPAITNGSGRLELANWVASPENPLTARVMVNRIWQHHFGEGIVRTPNNFGKLGTLPTHPELLDYLAHRFIDSGWSIKAMQREIMLSATYQQSSVPQPPTHKEDPDTLLIGRMSRHRMESEALRDSLLCASGKMDGSLGGPSIRDLNTLRRTLYVATIRSDRATYQFLFDAADPTTIAEKRLDSTVAPQALFLMNNSFVENQVKLLSQRVLKEAPRSDKARVKWLYQLLYSRPPSKEEIAIGLRSLKANEVPKSEAMAWENYCQILICANEFIYLD